MGPEAKTSGRPVATRLSRLHCVRWKRLIHCRWAAGGDGGSGPRRAARPLLKVKIGGDNIPPVSEQLISSTDSRIILDANEA
jgi:hypothetical protein